MDFKLYCEQITLKGSQLGLDEKYIAELLKYSKNLYRKHVPIIFDYFHFSQLVGVEYSYLFQVSNSQRKYYTCYYLPKRKGGYRVIMEPLPVLKIVQSWILTQILTPAIDSMVSSNAKAYLPGMGIKDNVRFHRNKKIVLNIDLKDFFDSIKFSQVVEVFKTLGYTYSLSVLLANLCTLDDMLPQGAPTSPMLSNMVFKKLDDRIFSQCKSRKIMYTRYADDMTFSGDFDIKTLRIFVEDQLRSNGFRINHKKTSIKNQGQRQTVTNITVNKVIQTSRSFRYKLRQAIYYIEKYGIEDHMRKIQCPWSKDHYLRYLRGQVNYALYINPKDLTMKRYKSILYELS